MEVELEVEMFWRCNFRVKTQFPRPAPPRDWSLHPDDILCNPFLWICPDSYQISAAPLFVFTEIRYCYKILSGRGERREERGERTGPAQHVGYYYIRLPGWLCGDQHIRKYLVGVQAWGSEALLAIMIETYWELHGCLPALDLDYDQVEPDNKWRHPEIYIRILDMWDVRLWEQQTSVPCYCEVYQRPKYLFIAERLSSSTGTRGWNLKIYTNTDHQSDRV